MRNTIPMVLSMALLAGCPVNANVDGKANVTNTTINNNGPTDNTDEDAGSDNLVGSDNPERKPSKVEESGDDAGEIPSSDAGVAVEQDAGMDELDAGSTTEEDAATAELDAGSTTEEDAGSTTEEDAGSTLTCTLGQKVCNGNRIQACDGSKWVDGKFCSLGCNEGACNVCNPGDTQCNGASIETCVGSGWTATTTCPYTCSAGACIDQLCEPGALMCSDTGDVLKCADSGVEWTTVESCDLGCTNGVCHECADNTEQCDGLTVQLCVDGFWANQDTCSGGCVAGICTECQPGAKQCADDGDTTSAQVCDATGMWTTSKVCDGDSPFCTDGECGECDPGTSTDQCVYEICWAGNTTQDTNNIHWSSDLCHVCDAKDPNCKLDCSYSTLYGSGGEAPACKNNPVPQNEVMVDAPYQLYLNGLGQDYYERPEDGFAWKSSNTPTAHYRTCTPKGHWTDAACSNQCGTGGVGCY